MPRKRTAQPDLCTLDEPRRPYEKTRAYHPSPAEREIILGKCDDESHWHVYCSSLTATGRRLRRIAEAVGAEIRQVDAWGWEAQLPKAAISFRVPRTFTMSEAQRKAAKVAGERLAKVRVRRTHADG